MNEPHRPTDESRPPLRTTPTLWPAIAAGLAALLGMGSCAVTVLPLTGFVNAPWAAPIIGLVLAGVVFRALLPLRPSAETAEGQRAEIRLAVAAAWLVAAAIGLIVSGQVNGTFRKADAALDVYIAGFMIGALIGAIFARMTYVIGHRYFRRRQSLAHGSSV